VTATQALQREGNRIAVQRLHEIAANLDIGAVEALDDRWESLYALGRILVFAAPIIAAALYSVTLAKRE
jgi:hypothetical protein